MQTKSYAFNLKYTSYKSHTSREIEETSKGYYKRNENNFKCEAMGVLNFQNNKFKITVDSADKIISVSDPSSLNFSITEYSEMEKMLGNVKALRKKSIGKSTTYRIDFKNNEIMEAYEFRVSESGLLEQSVYYYSEQTENEYPDEGGQPTIGFKVKPRLEIEFTEYKYPVAFKESEFSELAFVVPERNKITATNKYRTYHLIDYRYKAKK